ncbi:hypothetical protein [Staphylococcus epidermidis]|nr:hypothetical protein [Staphylococcus epidermidis]
MKLGKESRVGNLEGCVEVGLGLGIDRGKNEEEMRGGVVLAEGSGK